MATLCRNVLMGAHESRRYSSDAGRGQISAAGAGTGDRKASGGRTALENRNVFPVENLPSYTTPLAPAHRQSGSSHQQTSPPTSASSSRAEMPSRSRVAYVKAAKKARDRLSNKPPNIPHHAIVRSMAKDVNVQSILSGVLSTSVAVIGGPFMLPLHKNDGATSKSMIMKRSQSEQIVRKNKSPETKNRVTEQMKKEKQLNEHMRTDGRSGGSGLTSRTQSFILPKTLHVIPEQPEDESKEPESYSYSEMNVYF